MSIQSNTMMKNLLRQLASSLPEEIKDPIREAKRQIKAVPYYGQGRHCPVCGHDSKQFLSFGLGEGNVRHNAQCPRCGSLERHRLSWLFLQKHTTFFDGKKKRALHIAPEPCLEKHFKRMLGSSYISADLYHPRAMVQMDITDITYPNDYFDAVYCSHVLEHVLDDRQAMREFYRTLKPDGFALLLVPIGAEVTFEDPSVTTPEERAKVFGQSDHVRIYGHDYIDRLREAGFHVKQLSPQDLVSNEQITTLGLGPAAGDIFYCTKQQQQ